MNYQNFNDYELVYLVEENDDAALKLLLNKYQPYIKKMVYRFYSSLKKYGIEYDDLYQEAYLAFLSAIKLFDHQENVMFYTFLNMSVRSRLLNYRRCLLSKKNIFYYHMLSLNANVTMEDDTTLMECVCDPKQENPALLIEYKDLENRLKEFDLELPPIQSQIFELLYSGFDNKEIAVLLELENKMVNNYLYRIRKRLKLYLAS